MDNRENMKAFSEWICSITPNSIAKSIIHGCTTALYERDYILVTNLCNGFGYIPKIPINTIDGAKERYKEYNKVVLEASPLPDKQKKHISDQIDLNAETLKQQWINRLQQRDIVIID